MITAGTPLLLALHVLFGTLVFAACVTKFVMYAEPVAHLTEGALILLNLIS